VKSIISIILLENNSNLFLIAKCVDCGELKIFKTMVSSNKDNPGVLEVIAEMHMLLVQLRYNSNEIQTKLKNLLGGFTGRES